MSSIFNNPDRFVSEIAPSTLGRQLTEPIHSIVTNDTSSKNEIYSQFSFSSPYALHGTKQQQLEQAKKQQEERTAEAERRTKEILESARKLKDDAIAKNAVFMAQKLGEAVGSIASAVGSGLSTLGKMFKG